MNPLLPRGEGKAQASPLPSERGGGEDRGKESGRVGNLLPTLPDFGLNFERTHVGKQRRNVATDDAPQGIVVDAEIAVD